MNSIPSKIQQILVDWFNRKTNSSAVRRIALSSIALATDIGLVRSENQDRCGVLRLRSNDGKALVIIAVCDGMGGMQSGADCASMTIATFFSSCAEFSFLSPEKMLTKAVLTANQYVFSKYAGRGGATLSAVCVDHTGRALGVNVGDSRIYCNYGFRLIKISNDDTLAGQLDSEAEFYAGRNDLLQYVGIGKEISPHILDVPFFPDSGCLPLITSDGVHFLDEKLIGAIIFNAPDSAKVVQRLTDLSKWFGGHDNATVAYVASYEKLLEFRDEAKADVVEVWDSFGETQVVLVNASQHVSALNKNSIVEQREPYVVAPSPKKRKKKTESKALKNNEEIVKDDGVLVEKPQIKIEFDDSNEA